MINKFATLMLLLLATWSASGQNAFPVRFAHGTEFFPENYNLAQKIPVDPSELVNGFYTRYIQLNKIMDARERALFESSGAKIISYVQFGAYLVILPQSFEPQSIARFEPRSIVPVNPEWKMARSLRERPYGEWAVRGDYVDINLQLYPSVGITEGQRFFAENNYEVLKTGTQNGFLQLRVHKDRIAAIADLPMVQYLELVPPPAQKEDTRGRSLHRSNLVASEAPLGKKYDGTGVSVLVRDDGQLGPHIDLQGRLHNQAAGLPNSGTHGDGVVGIIGGGGNLNPGNKGMAAGTDLYSVDYVYDFQDQTLPLHVNNGVTLTNSSYSDGCNLGYTLATQTVDQQIFEHPTLMHVFSAGNSNDVDCGYGAGTQWGNITGGHKMAKNAIATANVYADATLVQSSSRGPAYDGRLKPDISANGQDQESLSPDNTYQTFGGTSGAAPGIAGCLAQLTHAYRSIYGVNDVPAALLKVTLLNTANDLGNPGPDFKFGWGHVNTWRALRLLEQNQWLEGNADQNGNVTHSIQIPAGVKEAKIMLYWAEPPSAENNARALLNDLDLSVSDGSGGLSLPWKLDPTPNAIMLDAPAGKGRDSLNNVEQVLLENPAAGTYTVHIKGTEVPFGPQPYYLVWEFVTDDIKVTYPSGGEGFVPGEVERIHWDAYGNIGTFTLRYSTDGGNSFLPIASTPGDRRMYDWTVPNTVSGKVHLLILRGAKRDTTDFPVSIVPVPENLQVLKACPDSITLSWTNVNDTINYQGYLLGTKYMELKGTSSTNSVSMPINSGADPQWLSVRSSYPDGTTGQRAISIYWPGGLLNCPQTYDLHAQSLLSPAGDAIISCGEATVPVTLHINNNGINPSSNATAFYQVNNNPPVSEALPDIPVGGSLDYTFNTPLMVNFNGSIILKTWVAFPNDVIDYNDTLTMDYVVASAAVNQFFLEKFESAPGFPEGWAVVNPDHQIGWQATDNLGFQVVGPDDIFGRSLHMDYYEYGPNKTGEEDYFYMIPVDLNGLDEPILTFQLTHARYGAAYSDGLRIEVFTNCDLAGAPVTVWEKHDPELATVPDQTSYYYPGSGADWRPESVDLSPFAGQKILVRFVAINGYGNSLYLDHIGVIGFDQAVAGFTAPDSICRLDTIVFQAIPSTQDAAYSWSFGSAANPGSANGIGPHQVIYPTSGNKNVRLIVSNGFGADTAIQVINVRQLANANFTFVQNGSTIDCNNTSNFAGSYLWDFGDGTTSTETNPQHTYSLSGTYTITLSATNVCRTHTKTATVEIEISGINELDVQLGLSIQPNPTAGDFAVMLDTRMTGKAHLSLFDAAGRKITAQEILVKQGLSRIPFEHLNLQKGVYQLLIQMDGKQSSFKIVVQ